jgi:hypothetical protein
VSAWLVPFRYQIDSRIRGLGLDSRPAQWAKTGNNKIQTAGFVKSIFPVHTKSGKNVLRSRLKNLFATVSAINELMDRSNRASRYCR